MAQEWQSRDTTTHQHHVIAHLIGATVLGHFVLDETLYILLDIGFVWRIFLDGEMGLLPHSVAVNELEVAEPLREQIKADIGVLLGDNASHGPLEQLIQPTADCLIADVSFFEHDDRRRLVITGEESNLAIETSLATADIKVYAI
jgi:hypothetical protein